MQPRIVERIRELDIDGATDGTGRQGQVGVLEKVHFRDVDGAEVAEAEGLPVARSDRPTLEQHLVERAAEATNVDSLRLSGGRRRAGRAGIVQAAAIHGHARDTRDGITDVGVRELPDVLSGDRIHHADGVFLDIHGPLQRGTDTGDDHFLQLVIARLRRAGRRRGLRKERSAQR